MSSIFRNTSGPKLLCSGPRLLRTAAGPKILSRHLSSGPKILRTGPKLLCAGPKILSRPMSIAGHSATTTPAAVSLGTAAVETASSTTSVKEQKDAMDKWRGYEIEAESQALRAAEESVKRA